MSPLADKALIHWLLQGDPAIRWQVQRDLLDAPKRLWSAEQSRIAEHGWSARLLARRGSDGRWANGLYNPKYTSTTYTLLELRRLGLAREHRAAVESTDLLLKQQVWMLGPRGAYWEACVAGFGLCLASYFAAGEARLEALLTELLAAQMPDGGWNCRRPRGATHSSFHTTINVLEGLRDYAAGGGRRRREVEAAEARGREFFCAHQLYRSHRTGRVVDSKLTRTPFPPRWRHDILRTLDYFQGSGAKPDPRLSDPIEVLLRQRRRDGRFPQYAGQSGKVWLTLEPVGKPSRWNTLRALRVLRWWNE